MCRRLWAALGAVVSVYVVAGAGPAAAQVVALGASQTYGKGVDRSQSHPAQLEAMLKAHGHNVHVQNAGISGDTTGGMLSRVDSAVPSAFRRSELVALEMPAIEWRAQRDHHFAPPIRSGGAGRWAFNPLRNRSAP